MRRRSSNFLAAVAFAGLGAGACAHRPPPPDALLIIKVTGPTLSQVYVDDVPMRRDVDGVRVAVRGGEPARITVRAPGHFTAYREVTAPKNGRREVTIALRPDPDEGRPVLPLDLLR